MAEGHQNEVYRHIVNWRAAAMLAQNPNPLHGRAAEANETTLVLLFPQEIKAGSECRIYLDTPDPSNGQHVYLDFRIRVTTTSLMGQISQFRHLAQILDVKPEQKAFYLSLLKHIGR